MLVDKRNRKIKLLYHPFTKGGLLFGQSLMNTIAVPTIAQPFITGKAAGIMVSGHAAHYMISSRVNLIFAATNFFKNESRRRLQPDSPQPPFHLS